MRIKGIAVALALGGIVAAQAGCGSDACEGPACAQAGSGGGAPTCQDVNACMATQSCPAADAVGLVLKAEASISTEASANPEIVDLVPGPDNRAILISSAANQLSALKYDRASLSVTRTRRLDTGSDTSNATSVKVAPDGKFAAVTVAEVDCGIGHVRFVDISDTDAFGTVLATVEVGYNPDSGAFSKDGKFFVTADEDDREDRPCKPADRHGGSATVIDLSGGAASAKAVQKIPVDHAPDSEPEGVKIAPDGTVLLAIQETSELGFFKLSEVPNAKLQVVALPANAGPDGVDVTADSKWAAVSMEDSDSVVMVDVSARSVIDHHIIYGSGEVPDDYNRDESAQKRRHEPEQIQFVRSEGALFVVLALQESHAVISFRVGADGKLAKDSITQVGVGWSAETNGRSSSAVGTEGLAVNESLGLGIAANEREGSVTLFSTKGGRARACP